MGWTEDAGFSAFHAPGEPRGRVQPCQAGCSRPAPAAMQSCWTRRELLGLPLLSAALTLSDPTQGPCTRGGQSGERRAEGSPRVHARGWRLAPALTLRAVSRARALSLTLRDECPLCQPGAGDGTSPTLPRFPAVEPRPLPGVPGDGSVLAPVPVRVPALRCGSGGPWVQSLETCRTSPCRWRVVPKVILQSLSQVPGHVDWP